jgi:hypothetical protein
MDDGMSWFFLTVDPLLSIAFLNLKYTIMMIRQFTSSNLQLAVVVCALIAAPKAHLALMAV